MSIAFSPWAKTSIEFSSVWGAALHFENIDHSGVGSASGDPAAVSRRVTVGGMGASAEMVEYGAGTMMGAPGGWPQAAQDAVTEWRTWIKQFAPGGGGPPPPPQETWFCYRLYAQAPGMGNYDEVYQVTGFAYSQWVGPFTVLDTTARLGVTGVRLKRRGGTSIPANRLLRDPIDLHAGDGWFADEETASWAELDYPAWLSQPAGTLRAEGVWGDAPGPGAPSEDWPVALRLDMGMELGDGCALNTDYVSLRPWFCGAGA